MKARVYYYFCAKRGNRLVAKSAGVIEINGNRYDAVSGQLVGAAKKVVAQVKSPAGGVIDGMVRKPALSIVSSVKPTNLRSRGQSGRVSYKAPETRRQTQRSRTLMRSAVSKPTVGAKKVEAHLRPTKSRTSAINPIRASRARSIHKDSRVEHFGKPTTRRSDAIPKQNSTRILQPSRAAAVATPKSQTAPALPSMVTSVSHQHLERLLDQALIQADAHKQALRSHAKGWRRIFMAPKWITFGATSLAIILLGGFFAWQNVPQVSMRIADTKAHVSASVPDYTPSGYGPAGPAQANDNQVSLKYNSSDKSGNYTITQQSSNWDSSSVAANAVPTGTQVQSSQVNGTTVYIYGQQNDATWVNHGVLFNLQDKANLSSDQILKIAGGL